MSAPAASTPSCRASGGPRRGRAAVRSTAAAVLVAGVALAAACGEPSPEEQVRAAIREAVEAAEAQDAGGLADGISDVYADAGGRDKRALQGLVALYLRGQGATHLYARVGTLRLDGPRRADVIVWVASASRPIEHVEQLGALRADLLRVELQLARERDGRWRVTRAAWRDAALGDFLP